MLYVVGLKVGDLVGNDVGVPHELEPSPEVVPTLHSRQLVALAAD